VINSQVTNNVFVKIIFLCVMAFGSLSLGKEYNSCGGGETRTELDNLCPMMEGANLPQCCPQAFGTRKLSCTYHIILNSGQPYLRESSYTTCENGRNVQKPCCDVSYRPCFEKEVTLQFIPRLIHRKECCLEGCPSSKYWMDGYATNPGMPQNGLAQQITPSHSLSSPGDPGQCINAIIGSCSHEMCPSSTPCPVIPSPSPNPNPNPGPPPNPGPDPAPNPGPTPGPSPDPGPSPQPNPPDPTTPPDP
jgi:hypothetical protein